jgi:hypothetical protein
MASTRNRNTPSNYNLEQQKYANSQVYSLYPNSQYGEAFSTTLPGNGLLPGQVPWNKLSSNAPDVESFLFGINSTNLVNPAPCFTPRLSYLNTTNIYNKEAILIPEPLVIEKKQRPHFT